MKFKRIRFIAFLVLAALILVSTVSALTAANIVPSTRMTEQIFAVTANLIKPQQCAGLNLTNIVIAANGSNANDLILGGSANETLMGKNGDDCILGAGGNDTLKGDKGNDILIGGLGDDHMDGGPKKDNDTCWDDTGTNTYKNCDLILP